MWWLLFFSLYVYGMERQVTEVRNSPFGIVSSSSEPTDDDEENSLCEVALSSMYRNRSAYIESKVKPRVRSRIRAADSLHIQTLRQIKSGEDVSQNHYDSIRDIVEQSIQEAFEDNQRKIDSKLSKKQSALIGVACTIITAVTAIVVDSTTCKK